MRFAAQPAVFISGQQVAAEGAIAPHQRTSRAAAPAVPLFRQQMAAGGATALVPRAAGTASQTVSRKTTNENGRKMHRTPSRGGNDRPEQRAAPVWEAERRQREQLHFLIGQKRPGDNNNEPNVANGKLRAQRPQLPAFCGTRRCRRPDTADTAEPVPGFPARRPQTRACPAVPPPSQGFPSASRSACSTNTSPADGGRGASRSQERVHVTAPPAVPLSGQEVAAEGATAPVPRTAGFAKPFVFNGSSGKHVESHT